MSEHRMFTKKITESDAFLDMSMSAQALYFHLCMNADDDGFIKNPKRITRMIGANDDDLKLLIMKSFVLTYESGVIVIKHWRMHNLIRKDRYHPTEYLEERRTLYLKDNGAYSLDATQGKLLEETAIKSNGNHLATTWQPNDNQVGNQMATEVKLSKVKLRNNNARSCKKNAFNNFKQIDYDFENLEKTILEN